MIEKWKIRAVLLSFVIVSCSSVPKYDASLGTEPVEQDLLARIPVEEISYEREVKPVLRKRCTVCHGCYDAPCQLKLNSYAGITRGTHYEKVYDGTRLLAMKPTRLFVDAQNDEQWRKRGFVSVLNRGKQSGSAEENLGNSTLYKMLRLKQRNPQPQTGRISADIDTGLDREQICAAPGEEFEEFVEEHPSWGMPFGFPNLSHSEYKTLVYWLAQGAKDSPKRNRVYKSEARIVKWEKFLNGTALKKRLVSRYIYEHLFLSHIHFKGSGNREFYRLVRSATASGSRINEIATVRPYDDPKQKFYYRFLRFEPTVVVKDHVVYELSPAKMQRYKKLFYKPKYKVSYWPIYGEVASNPFRSFSQLPVQSRYRFLLDNARFFIEGFVKGPVCRGQVALNVIEDQFWIFFFDPDYELSSTHPEFLPAQIKELQLPAAKADQLNFLGIWSEDWKQQTRYLKAKGKYFKKIHASDSKKALRYLWNGDGKNPNAALTIFRHFDSASVKHGLVGDYPETAWILDFPLLERIHYLLVAGFDVYGNVSHQLNTRLYMDFLRMEAEDQFLTYIPLQQRNKIRANWYFGIRENIQLLFEEPKEWMNVHSAVIPKHSKNPQRELYEELEAYLAPVIKNSDVINRCSGRGCRRASHSALERRANRAMTKISRVKGSELNHLPEVTFVRVRSKKSKQNLAYTLMHNKAYKSVSFMLAEVHEREPADTKKDTLTVVKGLEGSYPNFFFVVDEANLDHFTYDFVNMKSDADFQAIARKYGIRRTNPDFWSHSDWFAQYATKAEPLRSGVFDLNRYQIY